VKQYNAEEHKVIRKVKQLREDGFTLKRICEVLSSLNMFQRNGKSFTPTSLCNVILKNHDDRKRRFTEEEKEEIKKLKYWKYPYRAIAKRMNCSLGTISKLK